MWLKQRVQSITKSSQRVRQTTIWEVFVDETITLAITLPLTLGFLFIMYAIYPTRLPFQLVFLWNPIVIILVTLGVILGLLLFAGLLTILHLLDEQISQALSARKPSRRKNIIVALSISTAVVVAGLIIGLIGIIQYHPPLHPANLRIQGLRVTLAYNHEMQINHSSIVSLTLTPDRAISPSGANPSRDREIEPLLSSLLANFGNGYMPLDYILHPQPCISASLLTDPNTFSIAPLPAKEYPLQQDTITWVWSITPLHADSTPEEIPVSITFTGKNHCGNTAADNNTGPYELDQRQSQRLTVHVTDPDNPSINTSTRWFSNNPILMAISGTVLLLLAGFITWASKKIWKHAEEKRQTTQPKSSAPNQPTPPAIPQSASPTPAPIQPASPVSNPPATRPRTNPRQKQKKKQPNRTP